MSVLIKAGPVWLGLFSGLQTRTFRPRGDIVSGLNLRQRYDLGTFAGNVSIFFAFRATGIRPYYGNRL